MRRLRIAALVVASVLVVGGCDWMQWGGGPGHAGWVYEPDFTNASVPALVPSTVSQFPITGQVVTARGLVFAQRDNALIAFDVQTYGTVWTGALPAGTTAGGVPAVDTASNTVFAVVATASNPVLVGFDIDGVRNCNTLLNICAPVFRAQLGTASGPASPPVVDGGRVFANGASSVFAFDAAGQTNCATSQATQVCTPLWSASTNFSASGIGPTVVNGVVHDAATVGVRAFNATNGNLLWTDLTGTAVTATPSASDTRLFVPAGGGIQVFARDGCGASTCNALYTFAAKAGDAAGNFLATASIDGDKVFATNANGALYAWPHNGCGGASCQPSSAVALNAPTGGSTSYAQSVAIGSGYLFVLARRVVSGVDHVVLFARAWGDLHELKNWDLGAGSPAPGLSSASVAFGVVYASVAGSLIAVHPPAVRPLASLSVSPLALRPGFSSATFDYVLQCASGTNSVTLNMTAVAGGTVRLVAPVTTQPSASAVVPLSLTENQAAVIEATNAQNQAARYWIRCLPHDFPAVNVTRHPTVGSPTPGWYLTANLAGTTTSYAMILDTNGTPVWYKHSAVGVAQDVDSFAKNTVTFASAPASGFGRDPNGGFDVYNLETNQITGRIKTVNAPTDFHELRMLPNGNRLLLSYPLKHGVDLTGLTATPMPGPNSTIADCEVQEVNPQGQLVYKWDASDHIDPVTENKFVGVDSINNETVYDVYHCNSIDAIPGGDLLVSVRHAFAVVRIRRSDSKIIWKLGGTANNKDSAQHITIQNYPQGTLSAQHDARYLPNGNISVFDNQSFSPGPAQGVEFALNLTAGTAAPVFQFGQPLGKPSFATGNFRRYGDGDSVICWGFLAFGGPNEQLFSEVNAAGEDVLDVAFGSGDPPYRAVKVPTTRFDVNVLRDNAGK